MNSAFRFTALLGAVLVLLTAAGQAHARASYGEACSSCHSDQRQGTFELLGHAGEVDPAGGIGALKQYLARPGGTVDLSVAVTIGAEPGTGYGVAVVDAFATNGLPLSQGSSQWTLGGAYPVYYFVGPVYEDATHTFELRIPDTTAAGHYAFRVSVAGYANSSTWWSGEDIYVSVVPEAGSLAMMTLGLIGVGLVASRRRSSR